MKTKQKIAIVTGANRGIGKEISINLSKLNINVIGTTSNDENTLEANESVRKNNIKNLKYITLNLDNINEIDKNISLIIKNIGPPAILINNAGIISDNLLIKISLKDWLKVLNINLTSMYLLMKICLPKMILYRWGRIINISSIIAYTGNIGQSSYSASKAGIIGLSKSIAKEVARKGITINNIAPGFINTDMIKNLDIKKKNEIIKNIPMRKIGTPKDVYNVVEFLISEKSSYITGETIHVNGGLLMP